LELAGCAISQHTLQLLEIDRLCQAGVHAGFDALLTIASHRSRGHCDYRKVRARHNLVGADASSGFQPVHLGHLNVYN